MAGKFVTFAFFAQQISIGVFALFRSEPVTPRPVGDGVVLEIPGRIERYFRGAFTSVEGAPVVRMDVETAVAAVVAAEMPADAPPEALKAFAVAARSFYLSAGRRHARYDFCDTTHCQFHRESPPPSHAASRAAAATAGVQVAYRGRPFAPMYSASCGGVTLRPGDVGLGSDPYPYAAVRCERCLKAERGWTRMIRREDAGLLEVSRSEAARLALTRKLGWSALPGNNYTAHIDGEHIVFHGRGQGHGVGLCQRGSLAMAAAGAGFREIVRHYLPGTELTDSGR